MQNRDYTVEGIILFVYIIFIALFFTAIITASYGFLFALNYLSVQYPDTFSFIQQPNEKIEIYHLLLTSILLSICCLTVFKLNENYGNLIEGIYKSMLSSLSIVSEQLEKVDNNTKEINETVDALQSSITFEITNIKDELEKIEENTSDIKELKDSITSLEFTVSNLRD